jgi:predicted N-acetyltransferase YhbS
MKEAIKKSNEMGMDALFLLGDPDYYKRFGFNISNLKSDYRVEHFQELELTRNCLVNLKSKVTYANAFLSL